MTWGKGERRRGEGGKGEEECRCTYVCNTVQGVTCDSQQSRHTHSMSGGGSRVQVYMCDTVQVIVSSLST